MRKPPCQCAKAFEVHGLKSTEYQRLKNVLNAGRHPTFIGRMQMQQTARNGGVVVFSYQGQDVAAALVNPRLNVLTVLCVAPAHRNHGLGAAILTYLQANFARVLESAIEYFVRQGYVAIGDIKQGRTLSTQIMVRKDLMNLAGRIASIFSTL